MAHLAEDESAGIADKPWPRAGEKWLHPESGHVVTVEWLHCVNFWTNRGTVCDIDKSIGTYTAKCSIRGLTQCVMYIGDDNEPYFRSVENFLANFERVG